MPACIHNLTVTPTVCHVEHVGEDLQCASLQCSSPKAASTRITPTPGHLSLMMRPMLGCLEPKKVRLWWSHRFLDPRMAWWTTCTRSHQNAAIPFPSGRTQTQTPGQIQNVDPPYGSTIHTIGVLESRIGGSTFWKPTPSWAPLP